MANWCSNSVTFEGEQSQMTDLKILFDTMALKEQKQRKGQLPEFIFEQDGYFFDIRWEDDALYYETKWSPNTAVIMEIAVRFGVEFSYGYEESSMGIYGEATFKKGVFTDTFLDQEDFSLYHYHNQSNLFVFEGDTYESNSEILDILLERKKAIKSL